MRWGILPLVRGITGQGPEAEAVTAAELLGVGHWLQISKQWLMETAKPALVRW